MNKVNNKFQKDGLRNIINIFSTIMNDTSHVEYEYNVYRYRNQRLPPEVNRILFVKNLPFKLSDTEYYEIFGQYGTIRMIKKGTNNDTRGTAFIIYEDIYEAKSALEALQGYNVKGRYLVVLYHQRTKLLKKLDMIGQRKRANVLREQALAKQRKEMKKHRK